MDFLAADSDSKQSLDFNFLPNSINPHVPNIMALLNPQTNNTDNTLQFLLSLMKNQNDSVPAKKACLKPNFYPPVSPFPTSSGSSTSSTSAQHSPVPLTNSQTSCKNRKPPAPIPDDKKDDAYRERRKKNNDAAKKSRDARKAKEVETANKAAILEQENNDLKMEISKLRMERDNLKLIAQNVSLLNNITPLLTPKTEDN